MRPITKASLISGCAWGVLVTGIAVPAMGRHALILMVVSPVIGLIMGRLVVSGRPTNGILAAFYSLLGLYVAAVLLAAALGVYDFFLAPGGVATVNGLPVRRYFGSLMIKWIIGILYMLTLWGWVLILWPAAYLNHCWIWSLATKREVSNGGLTTR